MKAMLGIGANLSVLAYQIISRHFYWKFNTKINEENVQLKSGFVF